MPWATNSLAAERPARPEPTTIAILSDRPLLVDIVVLVRGEMEEEVRCRQRMDAMAIRREIEMMARSLLRDIRAVMKRWNMLLYLDYFVSPALIAEK